MQDYSHIQKPDLGYRYEFSTDELDQIDECLEAHGFAIIKDALPEEIVERQNCTTCERSSAGFFRRRSTPPSGAESSYSPSVLHPLPQLY
ncbi:MAG: hypothetical protein ACKVJG_11140 [Candidatus Latescibacterota bacterium]|jgi:hypothetical protein